MTKLDDALQLDRIANAIANAIADQFNPGFCDYRMVDGFAEIVKKHINTDARDIKLLKQELSHLRAFNEELHTKYKEDIIDVAKKNADAKKNTELRDHFAGLAMQGLVITSPNGSRIITVKDAYDMAYAMIAEREKRNEIL
jgi:hypothetical protein